MYDHALEIAVSLLIYIIAIRYKSPDYADGPGECQRWPFTALVHFLATRQSCDPAFIVLLLQKKPQSRVIDVISP